MNAIKRARAAWRSMNAFDRAYWTLCVLGVILCAYAVIWCEVNF